MPPKSLEGPFQIPASNEKGQSVTLSFQVTPDLYRKVQDLVYEGRATGKFPWKTIGEVGRWLLTRALTLVAEALGDGDTKRFHEILTDIERWEIHRKSAEELRDRLSSELRRLLAIRAVDEATIKLHLIVPKILKLESLVWREWVMQEIKHEFGDLLNRPIPSVSLTSTRPEQVLKGYRELHAEEDDHKELRPKKLHHKGQKKR